MPVTIERVNVNGLTELEAALKNLYIPKFRRAALRKSGKEAMKPVLRDAISNAPIGHGTLKSDIKMRAVVNSEPTTNSGNVTSNKRNEMDISVRTGKSSEEYALVTEFGRQEFEVTKTTAFGKSVNPFTTTVSSLKPQPFLGPALRSNSNLVLSTFSDELGKAIITQARKQARFEGI